ncbi:hypothetical protein VCLMA_B0014 [Vibrio cholerae LMA3984-4]|nr:hypothetical protein VCLMA_B0014 [Vibrio cholerae LMA3984-4]
MLNLAELVIFNGQVLVVANDRGVVVLCLAMLTCLAGKKSRV